MFQMDFFGAWIALLFISAGNASATNLATGIDECAICCEQFDAHFHVKYKPLCGHELCQICLAQIASLNEKIPCPLCRKIICANFNALGIEQPQDNDSLLEGAFFMGLVCQITLLEYF